MKIAGFDYLLAVYVAQNVRKGASPIITLPYLEVNVSLELSTGVHSLFSIYLRFQWQLKNTLCLYFSSAFG